jgi:hypothetical protein
MLFFLLLVKKIMLENDTSMLIFVLQQYFISFD